ncbi:hypothetical protein J2778_002102 [Paraburkholderia graminis]|uniref:hypothetical protein n=1 Tax=Paraburkholderia graminis TaxID=60548 RepID=UPI00285E1BD6|nr:hypothetical protein [Paraburkholderia graminis]MDR6474608.1 hypothetical protein [Paraburkholderia graminis]
MIDTRVSSHHRDLIRMEKNPSYVPDLLFIKLPPQIAEGLFPVDPHGKTSLDLSNWRLAGYLFHEWIHYVHNVSTLNGLYAFASMINMWANFRHKLDGLGQSVDANVLNDYAASSVKRTHLYRKEAARYERNMFSVLRKTSDYVTIVSVKELTQSLPEQVPGHEAERVSVISCEAENPIDQTLVTFEVGTVEILEGIAFMLEEKLLMANGELPSDIKTAPYKLLQSLARHLVHDIENDQIIAIAIAALQTDDPPLNLVRTLRKMLDVAVDTRMAWLEGRAKAYLKAYEKVVDDTIDKTAALFPLSEPMGDAVKDLLRIISSKIALRMQAPFFELLMLKQIKDEEKDVRADLLGRIIAEFTCPRILVMSSSNDKTIAKDLICNWGSPFVTQEALFGSQKLHAALHYLLLHLSDDGFFATDKITASEERKRCPFYTACDYPLRHDQPDLCAHRPWESLAIQTDPRFACWYRAGVRATRPYEFDDFHPS